MDIVSEMKTRLDKVDLWTIEISKATNGPVVSRQYFCQVHATGWLVTFAKRVVTN